MGLGQATTAMCRRLRLRHCLQWLRSCLRQRLPASQRPLLMLLVTPLRQKRFLLLLLRELLLLLQKLPLLAQPCTSM